ncbi:hypothetical protein [Enhygromyxa salina]|nr:hypothetical protein [Enhygromyxa salina]
MLAPALVCSLLAPGLVAAAPPADVAAEPAPAPAPIEVTAFAAPADASPAEAPVAADVTTVAPPVEPAPETLEFLEDDIAEPDYYEEPYETYDPGPDKRTTLELQSGYFGLGIAPGMTLHHRGFHPNTRFELEFGGTLEHEFRDLALSFGVATQITPYYERKTPSYGADVTSTVVLGPVYLRTGLGAVGGIPRDHSLLNTAAAIGGVVGAGLTFHRAPQVRVGVDYDFRLTTRLEPIHTVFIALRLACCRSE